MMNEEREKHFISLFSFLSVYNISCSLLFSQAYKLTLGLFSHSDQSFGGGIVFFCHLLFPHLELEAVAVELRKGSQPVVWALLEGVGKGTAMLK